jgi:hypothetical protein
MDQVGLRNGKWQWQQVIRDEAEQEGPEKEEGRSRDDACRAGVVHYLGTSIETLQ